MHRSRLSSIMIDCDEQSMEAGVHFWSGALGMATRRPANPADPYVELEGEAAGLHLELQRIGAQSRIHLDIETDDLEAEVRRLEALGATREAKIEGWQVMRDPAGHVFCVVNAFSPHFKATAHTWED